jgi:hypothetical protein
MMRPDAKVQKVYLYPKPVDFRKSINGLAALVELDIKVEVFNPVLFVFLNPESNPCPHGSSNGGPGGCVIVGGGVGEPPNRQCTALLNQGIDLLNHDIASKTLSGVKLELCTPWRAVVLSGPNAPFGLRQFPGSLQPYIHQTPLVIHRVATP